MVLKICSKFVGEHPYWSVISLKLFWKTYITCTKRNIAAGLTQYLVIDSNTDSRLPNKAVGNGLYFSY